jgi:hypothetical protein
MPDELDDFQSIVSKELKITQVEIHQKHEDATHMFRIVID